MEDNLDILSIVVKEGLKEGVLTSKDKFDNAPPVCFFFISLRITYIKYCI